MPYHPIVGHKRGYACFSKIAQILCSPGQSCGGTLQPLVVRGRSIDVDRVQTKYPRTPIVLRFNVFANPFCDGIFGCPFEDYDSTWRNIAVVLSGKR
jgi:hypothetical protein